MDESALCTFMAGQGKLTEHANLAGYIVSRIPHTSASDQGHSRKGMMIRISKEQHKFMVTRITINVFTMMVRVSISFTVA
jgi:hypothetical protein